MVYNTCCCFFIPIPAADISYAVGTTRHGKVTDPHPPGMRVRCSSLEEEFEGTKPKHGGNFVISGKNWMGEKDMNLIIRFMKIYYNYMYNVQLEFDVEEKYQTLYVLWLQIFPTPNNLTRVSHCAFQSLGILSRNYQEYLRSVTP